jgi:hypothetical protein
MKKVIFLSLIITVITSGCNKCEATDDDGNRLVIPSFTTHNFGVEGGSVTLTGDVDWGIDFIEATDSKGVPMAYRELPDDDEFLEVIHGNIGERTHLDIKVKTSWATITRKTLYEVVIDVQPNTSGNERWISIHMVHRAGGVPVKITQSAE